jgi:hypothetical protein
MPIRSDATRTLSSLAVLMTGRSSAAKGIVCRNRAIVKREQAEDSPAMVAEMCASDSLDEDCVQSDFARSEPPGDTSHKSASWQKGVLFAACRYGARGSRRQPSKYCAERLDRDRQNPDNQRAADPAATLVRDHHSWRRQIYSYEHGGPLEARNRADIAAALAAPSCNTHSVYCVKCGANS